MAKQSEQKEKKRQISLTLHGADLDNFEAFKARERLHADAEVARKLILERLDEVAQVAKVA